MKLPTLTQMAKSSCDLVEVRDKSIIYSVDWSDTEPTLTVSVPLDEAVGTFDLAMPGIRLLRWIRKHVELLQQGLDERNTIRCSSECTGGRCCEVSP